MLIKYVSSIVVGIIRLVYELCQDRRRLAKTIRIMHKMATLPKQRPKYEDMVLSRVLRAYPAWVTERESLCAIWLYQVAREEICKE